MIRPQRMVSYFGTHDSVDGLMRHLGDGEEQAASRKMLEICWEDRHGGDAPYKLFKERKDGGDEVFRDFVGGLLDLDPKRRTTAEKALRHEWLQNVQGP
jgi:serine/threonine protein kinase